MVGYTTVVRVETKVWPDLRSSASLRARALDPRLMTVAGHAVAGSIAASLGQPVRYVGWCVRSAPPRTRSRQAEQVASTRAP
jgi:hypothetical protein